MPDREDPEAHAARRRLWWARLKADPVRYAAYLARHRKRQRARARHRKRAGVCCQGRCRRGVKPGAWYCAACLVRRNAVTKAIKARRRAEGRGS